MAMGDGVKSNAKEMPTPPNANIRLEASMGTCPAAALRSEVRLMPHSDSTGERAVVWTYFLGVTLVGSGSREMRNGKEKEKRGRSRSFAPSETPVCRRKTGAVFAFIRYINPGRYEKFRK
jgi:hypothetical protein